MSKDETILGPGKLRNVGPATLADLKLLSITTMTQLATQDADRLPLRLCEKTSWRHDPCVHHVFRRGHSLGANRRSGELVEVHCSTEAAAGKGGPPTARYRGPAEDRAMTEPNTADLTPVTGEETEWTLSFALRFDGRKHHHRADEAMARIVTAHLNRHLRQSGFVVMKKPPARYRPRGRVGPCLSRRLLPSLCPSMQSQPSWPMPPASD